MCPHRPVSGPCWIYCTMMMQWTSLRIALTTTMVINVCSEGSEWPKTTANRDRLLLKKYYVHNRVFIAPTSHQINQQFLYEVCLTWRELNSEPIFQNSNIIHDHQLYIEKYHRVRLIAWMHFGNRSGEYVYRTRCSLRNLYFIQIYSFSMRFWHISIKFLEYSFLSCHKNRSSRSR